MSLCHTLIIFFSFFRTSLLTGTTLCSRFILYISCSSPRNNHFSNDAWFLLLRDVIKNQDLNLGYIYLPVEGRLCCFQFLVIMNKDVTNICTNICMQGFVYKYVLILLDKYVEAQLLNPMIQLCLAL